MRHKKETNNIITQFLQKSWSNKAFENIQEKRIKKLLTRIIILLILGDALDKCAQYYNYNSYKVLETWINLTMNNKGNNWKLLLNKKKKKLTNVK